MRKTKNHHILSDGTTSQKLLEIDCKWVEETSQFNKYFMKKYSDDSN